MSNGCPAYTFSTKDKQYMITFRGQPYFLIEVQYYKEWGKSDFKTLYAHVKNSTVDECDKNDYIALKKAIMFVKQIFNLFEECWNDKSPLVVYDFPLYVDLSKPTSDISAINGDAR
jgi:hypothetical protein